MRLAAAATATAVLCLSVPALAQTIVAVSPGEGTIGTLATISGTGFRPSGSPAANVVLWNDLTKKKHVPKIVSLSDTQVVFELTTGSAGPLDVILLRDGVPLAVAQDAFTVRAPRIEWISDSSAESGDTVTVYGTFFGKKKGKVRVGGKVAKVESWSGTVITFAMPKYLSTGPHDLEVRNAVGAHVKPDAFGKSESEPGGVVGSLRATVAGKAFEVDGSMVVCKYLPNAGPALWITATRPGAIPETLTLNFVYDLEDNEVLPRSYGGSGLGSVSFTETADSGGVPSVTAWSTAGQGDRYCLCVLKKNGTTIQGVFSATANLTSGSGTATRKIEHGEFTVTVKKP
jgi:IPT/TIG domain-containing protein